ncbi:DUF3310 domain-containing protein [Brevibacillus brevis]|uniref:DUF3310 domain-containing protein n=1 Tax=Brevibacillus brevis TaxID=1393 RepID=UPI001EE2E5CC|nr:DUF3310 domain-containing protein [Brevibacillus brevis]
MAAYRVKRAGTPIPKREVELKSSGNGPVISYQLTPEEIANWKREGFHSMLTREKYLQLRLEGMSRTHIQRNYFPSNPTKFYALLFEWGLKEKDAEERELDLILPQKQETASNVDGSSLPVTPITELQDKIATMEKEIQDYISELRGERAENKRLLKELDEKQKVIDELSADREMLLSTIDQAVEQGQQDDPVNHPAHYATGGIETIDLIQAKLTPDEFVGFCKGNVLKYVTRANLKGGEEDLRKAAKYLEFAVGGEQG